MGSFGKGVMKALPYAAIPFAPMAAAGIGGAKYLKSANKPGGKKNAPPPSDYSGIAQRQADASAAGTRAQTTANRPGQSGPNASSQWTQDANGNWTQNNSFSGPLAGANQSAQQSLADAMKTPLQDGQQARDQAISAAYGDATKHLDPQWDHREAMNRTRLLNQGLDPTAEASRYATSQMGQQRSDAYGSAMNSAIGQGREAGDAVFRNSLMSKQFPLQQLQGMQGLLAQPGFAQAGQAQTPNLLAAANMGDQYGLNAWAGQNQAKQQGFSNSMDIIGQLMKLGFAL